MTLRFARPHALALCALALLLVTAAGCKKKDPNLPAAGSVDADKFLFDRGNAALGKKHWLEAREYFRRLVDTYPQSQYRQDAKLGIGDTYIGENSLEAFVLAINEFREFLTFFPANPRADYAQFKIAFAFFKQMPKPQRDQTPTREALRELDTFIANYPNSKLMPDAKTMYRQARDRLSDSEYEVGFFYYRNKIYVGAVARLHALLADDPQYSRRDQACFYLGAALEKLNLAAAAVPYYEKLLAEMPNSKLAPEAKKRLDAIKR